MEDYGEYAGALGEEEPLRGEVFENDVSWESWIIAEGRKYPHIGSSWFVGASFFEIH